MGVDGVYTVGSSFQLEQLQYLFEMRVEAEWTPSEKWTFTTGLDFLGGLGEFEVALPFRPADTLDGDPLSEDEAIVFGDFPSLGA